MTQEGKERLWDAIVKSILECRRCDLHKYRRKPVPGEGNLNARVMFIGEAPGRQEDIMGRPFVGQAGKLLDEMLSVAGLKRSEVFITNVVKCRPPNNRDPRDDEVEACSIHTDSIIRLIRPAVIVTLGNHSGKYVLQRLGGVRWRGVSRMRGRSYKISITGVGEVTVVPTYHPAAALYNPRVRPILESDFKLIGSIIKEGGEEGRRTTLLDFMGGGGER